MRPSDLDCGTLPAVREAAQRDDSTTKQELEALAFLERSRELADEPVEPAASLVPDRLRSKAARA